MINKEKRKQNIPV